MADPESVGTCSERHRSPPPPVTCCRCAPSRDPTRRTQGRYRSRGGCQRAAGGGRRRAGGGGAIGVVVVGTTAAVAAVAAVLDVERAVEVDLDSSAVGLG